MKVSIYEGNHSFLESLTDLIRGTEGFELCSVSPDIVHIVDDCRENCPDMVMMDMNRPELSGIEAIRLVRHIFPDMNIMILIAFEDSDRIFDALCAGANGYLLKMSPLTQIIDAIQALHRGGSLISSGIACKALKSYRRGKKESCRLSPSESEMLKRFAKGDSYNIVADALSISIAAIQTLTHNLYKKLHVRGTGELT